MWYSDRSRGAHLVAYGYFCSSSLESAAAMGSLILVVVDRRRGSSPGGTAPRRRSAAEWRIHRQSGLFEARESPALWQVVRRITVSIIFANDAAKH